MLRAPRQMLQRVIVLALCCCLAAAPIDYPEVPTLEQLYPLARLVPPRYIPPVYDPRGVLTRDLESSPDALRAVADSRCSTRRELVVSYANGASLDLVTNLVANLAAVDVHHYVVITDEKTCREKMANKLACVWTSLLLQPRLKAMLSKIPQFALRHGVDSVRLSWLTRLIYLGRLSQLGFSTMLLDADVILNANPFPLVEKHLPNYQLLLMGDRTAGDMRANGGTIYVRKARKDGPVNQVFLNIEYRIFNVVNASALPEAKPGYRAPHGRDPGEGAAESLLYDQNLLNWGLVGEVLGDREFVGRGPAAASRELSLEERLKLRWKTAKHTAPTGFSTPGGVFVRLPDVDWMPVGSESTRALPPKLLSATHRLSPPVPEHLVERLAQAPAWLFSAETAHRGPVAKHWGDTPPATALVHFVCTYFPGSEARRVGMRLLRRWYESDVEWVQSPKPTPQLDHAPKHNLIGFSSVLPLSLAPDDATLRHKQLCRDAPLHPTCQAGGGAHKRWRHPGNPGARASASPLRIPGYTRSSRSAGLLHRGVIQMWHRVLAVLAHSSGRRPVLPLFECAGILGINSRFGWVVRPGSQNSTWRARTERGAGGVACAWRVPCFRGLAFPEQLVAATRADPASRRLVVRLEPELLRAGGFAAVAMQASRGRCTAQAIIEMQGRYRVIAHTTLAGAQRLACGRRGRGSGDAD